MENNLASSDYDYGDYVRKFEESEQSTQPARKLCERDRDYYDGKQWTADEESKLKKRGQPVVTYNRIQRKVNYLKGLEAQTRKDPKAFPRTPSDDGSAQASTDALRYVCDDQNWDAKRSEAFEGIIVEGTGVIMVGAAKGRDGIDPTLVNIPWDRFFADPYSRRVDYSDAEYMGIVTWMDLAAAKRMFPQGAEVLETTLAGERDTITYDDRPKYNIWADFKRKRVRVLEMYCRENGVWQQAFVTRGGFLSKPQPSPYLDVDGEPECPIKAISAYVDRDNNRYGEVRAMISPQDEINHRRSKGLHLINSRQVRISRAATVEHGADASAIKRELARPDGVIFAEQGEVDVLQTGDLARANFELLQEAKSEIDLLGPNAALAGKNENDASGRALLAQQQGGMVEVALLMDRLRSLSLDVYRSVWARIKQYWDGPRWVRVTDDERAPKWVGLNTPRTMLEVAQEKLQNDPEAQFKLAMLARDPMANAIVEVKNNVAEMDVDIILDEGMDTPSVAAEQFDTLSKMMPAMTSLPPEAVKLLITASSLRDKDKLLEIVEKMEQGGAQGPEMEAQAAAAKAQAEGAVKVQVAQIQGQTDIEVAKIKAMTDAEIAQQQAEANAVLKEKELLAEVSLNERRLIAEHESNMRVEAAAIMRARQSEDIKRAKADEADKRAQAQSTTQNEPFAKLAEAVSELARPRVKVPVRDENGLIVAVQEGVA